MRKGASFPLISFIPLLVGRDMEFDLFTQQAGRCLIL